MPRDSSKAQLWASRLDCFRRSGLSISRFCRNEKMSLKVFSHWRKKLDPSTAIATLNAPSDPLPDVDTGVVRFVIEAREIKICAKPIRSRRSTTFWLGPRSNKSPAFKNSSFAREIAMLAVACTARVYLYMQAVDMRSSYDGLHAIVQSEFARDIRLGDHFMFINRRRDRLKIIWWYCDGLAIYMKRLESGSTQKPLVDGNSKCLIIDQAQLSMLLTGIDASNIKRRKEACQ